MNNKKTINLILRGSLFKENHIPNSSRKNIINYYNIDFFTMGINPYIYLIEKLKEKYNLNIYFSTYDNIPKNIINKIQRTFKFNDVNDIKIITCQEQYSCQFTTTVNAIKNIEIDADFTIVLRSDLILKKKLIDLIFSSNFPDDKISVLAFFNHHGLAALDILHIIPRHMINQFVKLLDENNPTDLHKLLHSNLPTSSLCGDRTFHVNCRTNSTGCAEFYTVYDGLIKNTDYNFTKETFRCHNLYITPENGVLSDGLIKRMANNIWEEAEAKAIKDIDSNSSVLDLGGCVGITSCLLNKKLNNPSNHVVLEANPMLISSLNGIRNENLCKFKIENKILGTQIIDKINFFINPHHAMDGSIIPDKRRVFIEQISQTTISELENKYSISFNALICDIEGAEWDMWKNILLHDNYFLKFHTIICEFHNVTSNKNNFDSIIRHLNNQSYKIIKYSSQVYGFFKNKQ